MWFIRWIVAVIVIIVVWILALQNPNTLVDIRILHWQWQDVPLYLTLFTAFVAGIVAFLLISVADQLRLLADLRRKRRELAESVGECKELQDKLEQAIKEKNLAQARRLILEEELETVRKEIDELKTPPEQQSSDSSEEEPPSPIQNLA